MSIKTNIGTELVKLGAKIFQRSHKFHRGTLKVSYSCCQNLASIISQHNDIIINKTRNEDNDGNKCNFKDQTSCTLNQMCREKVIIYNSKVQVDGSPRYRTHIGASQTPSRLVIILTRTHFANRRIGELKNRYPTLQYNMGYFGKSSSI